MTRTEALDRARSVWGPLAFVSFKEGADPAYLVMGALEANGYRPRGLGSSWDDAFDHVVNGPYVELNPEKAAEVRGNDQGGT